MPAASPARLRPRRTRPRPRRPRPPRGRLPRRRADARLLAHRAVMVSRTGERGLSALPRARRAATPSVVAAVAPIGALGVISVGEAVAVGSEGCSEDGVTVAVSRAGRRAVGEWRAPRETPKAWASWWAPQGVRGLGLGQARVACRSGHRTGVAGRPSCRRRSRRHSGTGRRRARRPPTPERDDLVRALHARSASSGAAKGKG